MKKIAIDIRALQDKRHSGVQEYLLNLLEKFFEESDNKYLLFCSGIRKHNISAIDKLVGECNNVEIRYLKLPNKLLSLLWRFSNWPNLDKFLGYPNVFFAPNLNILPKDLLQKTVITFHDLSFERFPEFFALKSRLWHKFIRPSFLAQKVKKIIAVSSSTKQDIIDLYNIREDKIKVIDLGKDNALKEVGDQTKLEKFRKKLNLPNNFLLYLGTLEPRKNIEGIIEAYIILRKAGKLKKHKLVLAGPKGWLFRKFFYKARQSFFKNDIIFIGPIKREERVYLYNLADVFIYPSFFEGFGLPPLEAMACNLPVITSNRSSLSSIVSNAAIMIDPYKTGELAWAIDELLHDNKLYKKLQSRGQKVAKSFSWQMTAEKTLKFLINH